MKLSCRLSRVGSPRLVTKTDSFSAKLKKWRRKEAKAEPKVIDVMPSPVQLDKVELAVEEFQQDEYRNQLDRRAHLQRNIMLSRQFPQLCGPSPSTSQHVITPEGRERANGIGQAAWPFNGFHHTPTTRRIVTNYRTSAGVQKKQKTKSTGAAAKEAKDPGQSGDAGTKRSSTPRRRRTSVLAYNTPWLQGTGTPIRHFGRRTPTIKEALPVATSLNNLHPEKRKRRIEEEDTEYIDNSRRSRMEIEKVQRKSSVSENRLWTVDVSANQPRSSSVTLLTRDPVVDSTRVHERLSHVLSRSKPNVVNVIPLEDRDLRTRDGWERANGAGRLESRQFSRSRKARDLAATRRVYGTDGNENNPLSGKNDKTDKTNAPDKGKKSKPNVQVTVGNVTVQKRSFPSLLPKDRRTLDPANVQDKSRLSDTSMVSQPMVAQRRGMIQKTANVKHTLPSQQPISTRKRCGSNSSNCSDTDTSEA